MVGPCTNLGVAYANGAGIDRNLNEAIRWFQSAGELGLTDAQFNLAVMYERGMGVTASLAEAYTNGTPRCRPPASMEIQGPALMHGIRDPDAGRTKGVGRSSCPIL